MFELRDYQKNAIETCYKYMTGRSRKPGVCVAPTGSGKSLLIGKLSQMLEKPTLVLQPSKEILIQNYNKAVSFGAEPTIYSASCNRKELSNLIYATIGSIKKEVDALKNIGIRYILIDECSSGYSPDEKSEFMKFIYQFHDLSVMGFTATPCRLHTYGSMTEGNYSMLNMLTKDVPRYFERMVYVIQIQEMIRNGFWAKIDYEVWDFDETNLILNSTGSEYTSDSILMSIATNGVNNTIYKRARMILESHEREHILICMDSVENAYRMRDFMNAKHGPIAEVVDGKTPKKKRDEIIEDFKAGKIKVVINYATLVIGFDFPELDCVIFGRPTFSFAIYYQVIGRCVRPHKNKKSALFVDCCNNFKRFGAVENVTIENVPYNGWTMFSGDKVISNIRMGDIVTRRMLELKAEKKIMANMARGEQNGDSVSDGNFVIRFGQYKGKKLCEIPVNYMKFLLEKCLDMSGYDKVARFYKFVTGLPAPQQTGGGER